MNVETIVVGPFEVNSYVVYREENASCLVVDPGADAGRIVSVLRTLKLTPVAYLITHGHADHVGALAAVAARYPAPVLMHAADAQWAFGAQNQIPPFYDAPKRPAVSVVSIEDREWKEYGPLRFQVLHTPGHTPGGVVFYFPDERLLFSGDTLFEGSVGRTDLPGADAGALAGSLATLRTLPDDTMVYPGHGPATTIGREKRTNYFLRAAIG